MHDAPSRLTTAQCRDAGLALTLILLLLAYFDERWNFVLPAIVVMVLAMLAPGLFRPWAILWWGLARVLAAVGSRILLTIVFGLILIPVALFRRMIGADAMRAKEWRGKGSVFVEREGAATAADLETPY
ncbi:MAG: hypothetical protein IH849_01065 [Acidobacteria bacterium]|nr:hypothetical protein [Acidobacteriota bacterium]